MIILKNTQRKITIDTDRYKNDAQKILDALDYADFDLSIWLTTNATIHTYNRDFRQQDKPTDILSFSYWPDLKAGDRIMTTDPEDRCLGDIIISPEYVLADLERWDQSFDDRMRVLLVHGICHLLGYDHIDDADYEIMKIKEKSLLDLF